MGTICAPNYAKLYMGFFERNFIFNPDTNQHFSKLLKYYRYIFCIFQGDTEELKDFLDLINGFKDNLKFTCEFSKEKIHFLDMWDMVNESRLVTTLYQKETDRNTLLLASSAHPTPLKKGLPKSQFYRLRRVCQTTEDFVEKSLEMKSKVLSRGYLHDWVEQVYNSALEKPRPDLLNKSHKKEKQFSVTCVSTYSPRSHVVKSVFMKHWHILKSDPELSSIFKDPPLFVHKRGQNSKDRLVHANFFNKKKDNYPLQTLLSQMSMFECNVVAII